MKSLKSILAVVLSITMILSLCVTYFAAQETDEVDADFMYKLYITDFLYNDMIMSGKSRDELLQKRADELGISDIRAYEIEIECGLHPVIYTPDERPLPPTVPAEPTEVTTAPAVTVEPTEVTTFPETTAPAINVTEPSEVITTPATSVPVSTATEPTEKLTNPADYEDIPIMLGDVNNDRKLNIKDATLIQKYLAKIAEFSNDEKLKADYNQDKVINIKDATTIQKKLANII